MTPALRGPAALGAYGGPWGSQRLERVFSTSPVSIRGSSRPGARVSQTGAISIAVKKTPPFLSMTGQKPLCARLHCSPFQLWI